MAKSQNEPKKEKKTKSVKNPKNSKKVRTTEKNAEKKSKNSKTTSNKALKVKEEPKNNNNLDKKVLVLLFVTILFLVALLLGTAFAYFSIQTNESTAKRNVTTTTPKVGTASLINPTSELHVTLDSINMAKEKIGSYYYATSDQNKDYETVATPRTIAKTTIVGGEQSARYRCTFNLDINITGTMKDKLQSGDATVFFSGAYTAEVDLASLFTSREIVMESLTGTNLEEELKIVVRFNNTEDAQDYLQGTTLSIETTNSNFACTTR